MITLQELKDYLNLDSSTVNVTEDIFLQRFINSAVSELSGECNRTFVRGQYVEYFNYYRNYQQRIFLKVTPVISIDEVEYLDTLLNTYSDLFLAPDTIANSISIYDNNIAFLKSGSNYGNRLRITYTGGYKFLTGTGTVTIGAGSTAVAGTGTVFTTQVAVGDYLSVAGERAKVLTVTDNLNIVLSEAMITAKTAKGYNVSTVPEDLQQAILARASMQYYDSPLGKSLLFKSSESLAAGGSTFFRKLDQQKTIENYRVLDL